MRPDIYAFLSDRRILIDVSVIHPLAATYLQSAQRPLGAAKTRENYKADKFAALTHEEKAEFVPFVMETTGALGKAARNFLIDTCLFISLADEFNTPFKVKDYILRSLAIELQRGNALVVQ